MSARPGPPTLQDVARRAGVHPATVSRALNHPDMVATATRDRVLVAVESLGFVPNRSAQRLAGGRSEAIGVVVPDIANPYFATVVRAVQVAAAEHGAALFVADSGGEPDVESGILATLGRRVDGLIACTPVADPPALEVPMVQVNRRSRGIPSVAVDQAAIIRLAFDGLSGVGHRHVAWLAGPARYWSSDQRARAVRRMTRDRGSHLSVTAVRNVKATFDGGRDALEAVLATGATAVVAFNDLQAAGLLVGAHAAGVTVPGDLSIIGSDGLDVVKMTEPSLATVSAPLESIGRRAFERLTSPEGPQHVVLEPVLEPGDSIGPPRHRRTHDHRRQLRDVG